MVGMTYSLPYELLHKCIAGKEQGQQIACMSDKMPGVIPWVLMHQNWTIRMRVAFGHNTVLMQVLTLVHPQVIF